jgi:hypothetical protein
MARTKKIPSAVKPLDFFSKQLYNSCDEVAITRTSEILFCVTTMTDCCEDY